MICGHYGSLFSKHCVNVYIEQVFFAWVLKRVKTWHNPYKGSVDFKCTLHNDTDIYMYNNFIYSNIQWLGNDVSGWFLPHPSPLPKNPTNIQNWFFINPANNALMCRATLKQRTVICDRIQLFRYRMIFLRFFFKINPWIYNWEILALEKSQKWNTKTNKTQKRITWY